MAVHVPLSLEAQAEARLIMFSHTNLLSPSLRAPLVATNLFWVWDGGKLPLEVGLTWGHLLVGIVQKRKTQRVGWVSWYSISGGWHRA